MVGRLDAGVRLWARTESRRRWFSLILLGVLAGLAAGVAIAAYDGAQRTTTAYSRMRRQFDAADAVVFPSQVRISDFDASSLATLAEVAAWGGFSLNASQIDGFPPGATPFITSGADWFTTLERAVVVHGRVPDPSRDDEAVITEGSNTKSAGLHEGSMLVWRSLSADQVKQFGDNGPPADFDWKTAQGPVTTLTIVGVLRLPMDSVASFAATGLLLIGPGWRAAHPEVPMLFTNALVRLRNGDADLPALAADVARLTKNSTIPIKDLATDVKRIQRSLDLEHAALVLFAATILVTALVLIGQALARATSTSADDARLFRALGMGRGGLVAGLTLPMLITVGSAVGVTWIVSVVASRWFPIGLAAQLDPSPGIHVLAGRESIGLVLTTVVLVLIVVGTALAVQAPRIRRRPPRSRVAGVASRLGASVPASVGASLALDSTVRSGTRPRLAVLAAIMGMIAVVGSYTLIRGIDDASDHPERTGATWDLVIDSVGSDTDQQVTATVSADADVADFAIASRVAGSVDDQAAPLYALQTEKGELRFSVVDGRAPSSDAEIDLGPATARLVHAGVGDTVRVGTAGRPLRVVGIALLPQEPHSSFDEGAWLTQQTLSTIGDGTKDHSLTDTAGLIRLVHGVSQEDALGHFPPSWSLEPPSTSADLANLEQVRSLPIYLAAFIVFLAAGAIAHALFTGSRQRSRELAVLRALGLSARQAAACVSWQAITIGVVAVIAGLPLGVFAGRRLWRIITNELSFVYVGPWARNASLLVAGACLVVCAVLAITPALRVARRKIA